MFLWLFFFSLLRLEIFWVVVGRLFVDSLVDKLWNVNCFQIFWCQIIFLKIDIFEIVKTDVSVVIKIPFFTNCQISSTEMAVLVVLRTDGQTCDFLVLYIAWVTLLYKLHFVCNNISDPNMFSNWIDNHRFSLTFKKKKRSTHFSILILFLNKVSAKWVLKFQFQNMLFHIHIFF